MPTGRLRWLALLLVVLLMAPAGAAENPLEEAEALNQQAMKLYKAGRYQEALPLAQQALEIREKALGA
jgi:tetratricopeptide (TPR) repeat protein